MGKSDQRYQRPKLSDQSVQKNLKTVELYANYYDAFQRQNTDSQSECRRSSLARILGNTGMEVDLCLYYAIKKNRFESKTFHTAIKK
ncbi:unnamed protein product [Gadus morhua 'NCC']